MATDQRPDVPAELIRPVAEVLYRQYRRSSPLTDSHVRWSDFRAPARKILAAIVPAHEAMVREGLAREYEAMLLQYPESIFPPPTSDDETPDIYSASAMRTAYRNAAKIARGEPDHA